jgi:hypothetical protein
MCDFLARMGADMNITLSEKEDVVERSRRYAREHGTSLNALVRGFLAGLAGQADRDEAADEFARNALEHGGSSPAGFRFNREAAHRGSEKA